MVTSSDLPLKQKLNQEKELHEIRDLEGRSQTRWDLPLLTWAALAMGKTASIRELHEVHVGRAGWQFAVGMVS